MDDDQNRTLDFNEFKKGMTEYGLNLEPKVCWFIFYCLLFNDPPKFSNEIIFFSYILKITVPAC